MEQFVAAATCFVVDYTVVVAVVAVAVEKHTATAVVALAVVDIAVAVDIAVVVVGDHRSRVHLEVAEEVVEILHLHNSHHLDCNTTWLLLTAKDKR